MQLPIKDNLMFRFAEFKPNEFSSKQNQSESTQKFLSSVKDLNTINDQNNPIIAQVVFFAKMFDKFVNADSQKNAEEFTNFLNKNQQTDIKVEENFVYSNGTTEKNHRSNIKLESNPDNKDYTNVDTLKEIIYKTYSKSIDKSKNYKKKEKKKMEKIMNLLIYLQMKKIEMKLNYFNDFEKLIQFETQQIKSMESQIIQERIKLAIKKSEIVGLSSRLRSLVKSKESDLNMNENTGTNNLEIFESKQSEAFKLIELSENMQIENEPKILDLN